MKLKAIFPFVIDDFEWGNMAFKRASLGGKERRQDKGGEPQGYKLQSKPVKSMIDVVVKLAFFRLTSGEI